MAEKIPERLVWTVERLKLAPDDRVLEIGCGPGVAAALVCDRLTTGKLTAIDRSEKAIAAEETRNRAHIEAGKAEFRVMALEDAALDGKRFDKIFAVNVNLFWTHPGQGLNAVRGLMEEEGIFYLVYHPPAGTDTAVLAGKVTKALAENGFSVVEAVRADLKTAAAVCITARVRA
jgi:cyclopropane fatty-acyl-phospholipid synthase-like methyltransferase